MAWCAVIGDPISHSLSPLIHTAAYEKLGVELEYRRINLPAAELDQFMRELPADCQGLSVTMPHKTAVRSCLDRVDGLAKVTGSVNTVVPMAGMFLTGFNTDVYGIAAACREFGVTAVEDVTILGAGATAASALAAAAELGAKSFTVIARRPRNIMNVAQQMGISVRLQPLQKQLDLTGSGLVISTLPAGATDDLDVEFKHGAALLDVVYSPWPTPLVLQAQAQEVTVIPGISMLVHQACQQVSLFTSHTADPNWMYAALAAANPEFQLR